VANNSCSHGDKERTTGCVEDVEKKLRQLKSSVGSEGEFMTSSLNGTEKKVNWILGLGIRGKEKNRSKPFGRASGHEQTSGEILAQP